MIYVLQKDCKNTINSKKLFLSNCDNCHKIKERTRKSLEDALEAIKNGSSVNRAAKDFDGDAGRFSSFKDGKPTLLSTVTEHLLFTIIIFIPDFGFALSKFEIIEVVKNCLAEADQEDVFKNNDPTDTW